MRLQGELNLNAAWAADTALSMSAWKWRGKMTMEKNQVPKHFLINIEIQQSRMAR